MSASATIQPGVRAEVRATTMQAIVQDRYGEADVLVLREIDRPVAREGEALIRVHAAGVEPGQWHLMTGLPVVVRLGVGLRRPKVGVRGRAVAGVVAAVGPGVTRVRPGDEVFGWSDGSFAEYVATADTNLAAKPSELSFVEAAALPISAETALQAVRDVGEVGAGQHVLVTGAGGGVGGFAVQIAKARGAEVTGACRASKVDLVRSIGADHVIDSREDLAAGGPRFDVIIDTAGIRRFSELRTALRPTGTLVIVGGEGGGRWFGGFGRNLTAPLRSRFTRQSLRTLVASERYADLETISELVRGGKLRPVIDRTYPLAQAADAMRYLHSGEVRGKIVVTV